MKNNKNMPLCPYPNPTSDGAFLHSTGGRRRA